jgi:hypothetical protein
MSRVYSLVTALNSDRRQVASQASSTAETADRIAQRLTGMQFDQAMTMRLMKSIAGDADAIAAEGERSAEQGTMVLDSLFIAYSQNAHLGNESQIKAAIHTLFQQLEDPSAYNGARFAREMKNLNSLLP